MRRAPPSLPSILDTLESYYGPQQPSFPTDPFEFLVWWYCGYPASDAACNKGWAQLTATIQIKPEAMLRAKPAALAIALKPGGMVPELRAERLKELAARVQDEFGGDLRAALVGPLPQARKLLKAFPSIGDPGADRILLFAGLAALPAVPSNSPYVIVRIRQGLESDNYSQVYREAQRMIEGEVPASFDARIRAFLLLKLHGQEICKRTNPKCDKCPVSAQCAYASGRGVERAAKRSSRP